MSVFLALFLIALVVSFLIRLDLRNIRRLQDQTALTIEGPTEETKVRTFPARLDEFRHIIDFVTLSAERANLNPQIVFRLKLAVEEAVTNICNYAYLEESAINSLTYAYENPTRLEIQVEEDADTFRLDISDQGEAFNPLLAPAPAFGDSLENFDTKGLGIHLLRKMADDVEYQRIEGKNVLSIVMNKKQE